MPGSASGTVLATPDADLRKGYCALVANDTVPSSYPTPVDLTIATGNAVTASTSAQTITIDSATLPIAMQVGQFLTFKDSAGSYLVEVTALLAAGAQTEITGISRENIPVGATAEFPCRLEVLTDLSSSETTATEEFDSYDHTVSEVSRGALTQSYTGTLGGGYYNAGVQTSLYAQRNKKDMLLAVVKPNPDSDTFTTSAPIDWAVGVVNDMSESDSGKLLNSFGFSVKGGIKTVAPS